jgi:hypothetical protein
MKTKMLKMMVALFAILPVTLMSCHDEFMPGITGHGEIVSQTIDPGEFDGFVSAVPAAIYLTRGDRQEVVVEAQQNMIDNIDLDLTENGIWTIRYHHPVAYAKPVKIFITLPTLTKAGIIGSGYITGMNTFTELGRLRIIVTGSGNIDLDAESEEMDVTITGSGDLRMSGTTGSLELAITGSGSFYGKELMTPEADMTISGSGSARLCVEEYLKVLVTGSGNVYYTGNPAVSVHVSGSGKVIHQ